MKNFLTLFKFQFRSQYGISLLKSSFTSENKKPLKVIGLGLVILIAFTEMIGLYSFILWNIFSVARVLGIPELVLTFGVVIAGLFILVFGIFYILSGIFFAKDSEFLSTLPVKQQTVFASKFALVMVGEYPFVIAMLLPPVLIYGINMQCNAMFYLLALICGLILPIIPLAVAAFFSLILMKIVSKLKRRSLFVSIAGIVLFVGVFLGNNLIISKFASSDTNGLMNNFVNSIKDLVSIVGKGFPPSIWVTNILASGGFEPLTNLLFLLLTSAAALMVVLFLASFIYEKGVQAQFETLKTVSKKSINYTTSNPVFSICKNEFKMIIRTPIYALNSFAGWFMGPLVVLMPTFSGALKDPDLRNMITAIQDTDKSLVFFVVSGLLTFFALVNPAPSSAISREGSGFWLLKSSPVLPRTYVLGKLICGTFISVGAVILAGVLLIVLNNIDIFIGVLAVLFGILVTYPMAIAGLIVDVIRPKLVWTNPQEVIKQNLNVVFGMLAGLLVVGVLGVVGYMMYITNFDFIIVVIVEFVLTGVISLVLQTILFNMADKKFS